MAHSDLVVITGGSLACTDGVMLTHATDSLAESTFPFVLVASKCDVQSSDGPCEPVLGNYEIHRTSPDSPRSQKMCIALVLRSVIGNKYGKCAVPGQQRE